MFPEEIRELARRFALLNAVKHDGKADLGAVVRKVISSNPEVRKEIGSLIPVIKEIVEDVNSLSLDEQRRQLQLLGVEEAPAKPPEEEKRLPPLPNVDKYPKVHVRFAPNPDAVIHLGNARAAILSDEYAKMYNGLYTLRFEDTSPSVKPPEVEAYQAIREDLAWLGVKWHQEVIQSYRLPLYYSYAEKALSMGAAYICTCPKEQFNKFILAGKSCPCRELPPEEHLERWSKMLDGTFKRGQAVLRIKTDLSHPNPAVRDWPAMRIDEAPHPLQGSKYRVWPLYNFACAIDDHELGITHILRGKEHEINTVRQLYLFKYFGWEYPEVIHYGRLKIEGAVLSKSKIREGIRSGIYSKWRWEDPRLGTICALRRRGFLPEAIRRIILDVGVRPSEALISWENLSAINRKLADPMARRLFFVKDPITLEIKGIPYQALETEVPFHPSNSKLGSRKVMLNIKEGRASVKISLEDLKSIGMGGLFRLMHLFNVELREVAAGRATAVYAGEQVEEIKRRKAQIIQWVPSEDAIPVVVVMPNASEITGLGEPACAQLDVGSLAQFVRFGFVRIDSVDEAVTAFFTHK